MLRKTIIISVKNTITRCDAWIRKLKMQTYYQIKLKSAK